MFVIDEADVSGVAQLDSGNGKETHLLSEEALFGVVAVSLVGE